jgi:hypothetical protein
MTYRQFRYLERLLEKPIQKRSWLLNPAFECQTKYCLLLAQTPHQLSDDPKSYKKFKVERKQK